MRTRPRRQGGSRLDETVTIPAGTTIRRTDERGHIHQRTFEYDVVLPSDCIGDGSVIVGGEYWEEHWTYED